MSNKKYDHIANFISGLETSASSSFHSRPNVDLKDRLSPLEIDSLYLKSDLAARIVDELVEDAMRGGWTVKRKGTTEEVPSNVLEAVPDPTECIEMAWKNARKDGGAAVFMVSGGRQSYLKQRRADTKIVNLVDLSRTEMSSAEWITDITDPLFAKPLTYSLSFDGSNVSFKDATKVHQSWLLRFEGKKLQRRLASVQDGWGDSVLQDVWITMRNFLQTESSIAEIVSRFEVSTFSIAGLQGILDEAEGEKNIALRVALVQRGLSAIKAAIIDKEAGEVFERSFAQVNGLDTIWDRFAHSVSKAAKMPMTQLFGMSPSGQSTDDESGKANWRKQVATAQDKILRPNLVKYYEAALGFEVDVEFPPLDEMSPVQEATVNELRAKEIMTYVTARVLHREEGRAILAKKGYIDPDKIDDVPEPEMPEGANPLLGDTPARAAGSPKENNDPAAKASGDA